MFCLNHFVFYGTWVHGHSLVQTTSSLNMACCTISTGQTKSSVHSCFAVPNQRYEFADADEAVLSDLALPNGTMMSPAMRALAVSADESVFDKAGGAVGVD